jgi:MraZ protein
VEMVKKLITFTAQYNLGKSMSFFIGNSDAKADAKGRIFIPSHYRKALPQGENARIAMRKDLHFDCLMLYPENVWNEYVESLKKNLNMWNPRDKMLLGQFSFDAVWLEIDSQGRVLIPKKYLQQIGAGNDVTFVGMVDSFALWAKDGFERSKLAPDVFSELLEKMMTKKDEL